MPASNVSDNGDLGDLGDDGELRGWGTATGLVGSYLTSGRGLTSTGLTDATELAGVDDAEELLREATGLGFGRLLELVPWAWARDGSGGAATRWFCTGMGCFVSRFTGFGKSC